MLVLSGEFLVFAALQAGQLAQLYVCQVAMDERATSPIVGFYTYPDEIPLSLDHFGAGVSRAFSS